MNQEDSYFEGVLFDLGRFSFFFSSVSAKASKSFSVRKLIFSGSSS
jgi:hypothetical protein